MHSDMARQHVATRLDEPEYEEIESITEEKGISRSEAVRRVVQDGLEARGRIERPTETAGSQNTKDTSVNATRTEDKPNTRTIESGQIIQNTPRQREILSIVQTLIMIAVLVLVSTGGL
uniref:Uncharacterized protein R4 n=1 Tax=Haloquadratum walsbyi TaxID=293091 RepID=A0A445MQJ2_9EURY|nr:ribbon-helix-helix protein, CopG family [Haloquadratum walsbyi]SPC48807.1 uncharacterized protein R4 [Haloquadratum walsbyi]